VRASTNVTVKCISPNRESLPKKCIFALREKTWTPSSSVPTQPKDAPLLVLTKTDNNSTPPHQIYIRKGTCDGLDNYLDSESLPFPLLQHDRYRGIGYCCSGGATSSLHADELAKSPTPYVWDASLRSLLLPHLQHFETNSV
jgi:hypothetical protein